MVDFNRQFNPVSPAIPSRNLKIRHARAFYTPTYAPAVAPLFRAFDSGLNAYVTWTTPTLTPLATDTTPNYTGALSNAHIEHP